jgi:D-alanine transaminase
MSIGFNNGEFHAIEQKVVPIEERGHQFGDGVYEFIKVYKGVPFTMREHLVRLANSAKAIRLEMNYSIEEIEAYIMQGIKRAGLEQDNSEVYLQVTRGASPRVHTFPDVPAITTMTIRKSRTIAPELREKGVSVTLLVDERWANCYIKSLNLLPNVLAKQTAHDGGFYEAVFFRDGAVTEGSSTNAYVIKDGTIYTHPATKRILHGITRAEVLKLAQELAIPVREEEFTPEFFSQGDEAFITSTSIEVMPVTSVDGEPIADGKPGPLTRKLYEAFAKLHK